MCDQCTTEALRYGDEVMPGFCLMKAQKEGVRWHAGDWGLVESNDPTVTWTSEPQPSPVYGMTDEQEEAWFKENEDNPALIETALGFVPDDFRNAFDLDPGTGYRLVMAGKECGYDPETSGFFVNWLWEHLGEHLKTAAPTPHDKR